MIKFVTIHNIMGISWAIAFLMGFIDCDGYIVVFFGLGGGSTSSTTTVNNIPSYAEPLVRKMLSEAVILSEAGYHPYIGITYATQNANETTGIARLASRGRGGDARITQAKGVVKTLLDGDYLLGTDVHFLALVADVTGKPTSKFATVTPFLGGSMFVKGDPNPSDNLAQSLVAAVPAETNARATAYLKNDNYQMHRSIQGHVFNEGLNLIKTEYDDAELLRYAGLLKRTYTQGGLTDAYNIYFENQIGKSIAHNRLKAAIAALVGSQQVETTQYRRAGGGLGVLGMVAGAALAFAFPPAGMGALAGISMGANLGGMVGGSLDQALA